MKLYQALLVLLPISIACGAGNGQLADGDVSLSSKASPLSTTCATCSTVTPAHPVILIHGRNDTSARWNALVTSWSTKGYTENVNLFRIDLTSYCGANSFCAMLPPPDGTGATYVNESYANCLSRYIDEKVPCTSSCPEIDLVSHSQGGVVARFYTRFKAPAHTPARVVNDLVVMADPIGQGITNCTLAGSCTGVNPEDCPGSALRRKINGVAPEGDGTNDETPGASPTGPTHYSATVSSKDTVVVPWCTGLFITSPNTKDGSSMNCKTPNYTKDPDADSCTLSNVMHLAIPSDPIAINDAYCKLNNPE
jgi:hypothetical protein